MPANEKKNCRSCHNKTTSHHRKHYGIWSGLLLALLPKCPFCVMAYSSTLVLCSKDSVAVSTHTNSSVVTAIITSFFCLLAVAGIYFNKRGTRTRVALWMSMAGTSMVMTGVLFFGGWVLYYSGVVILFAAVWLNGSLLYFINKGKAFFSFVGFYKPVKHTA
jgi:hypothetical protein